MADTKITALAAITTVDPAADVLPIVDISDTSMAASGTTKKITSNQILGAGGTATLASATITGNLTVDTNTFAVDASTNRVFVGTAPISTAYPFYVTRGGTAGSIAQFTDGTAQTLTIDSAAGGLLVGNANNGYLEFAANGLAQYRIAPLGVFSWYDGAGGTRMTLNSTGLGVGVTPSAWATNRKALQIGGLASAALALNGTSNVSELFFNSFINTSAANVYAVNGRAGLIAFGSGGLTFNIDSGTQVAGAACNFTQAMTLAANGQLLLGATSTSGAVDIGMVLNKPSASGFVGNVYQFNSVDKAYTYIASGASAYRIDTVAGYTVNVVSSTNGVYLANGGTSWLALSDERFKDIIEPISNAVAKVGSLRSVIGKFKSEAEGTRRSFLIAQDVQAVLPEAVDATKPDQLGVSYSDVIPLLVAAIKELTARVQTLEAR
jgi:hypothetical protein